MSKPQKYRPKFHVREIVPPELLINRVEELRKVKEGLLRKGSVLLVGKRGVGKTSMIYKAMHEMEREGVLCVYMDLTIYFDRNPDTFLEEVLLRICYAIGQKIFGKTYSELISQLGQEPDALGGNYKRFFRIFEIVRARALARQNEQSREVGLSTLVGAHLQSTESKSVTITPLLSFEFLGMVRELREICRDSKFTQIVVFADEANRLAIQTSSDILRSFFDVFSSEEVQFLFVTNPDALVLAPGIDRAFDRKVEIGPFHDISDLKALLEKYYNQGNKRSSSVVIPFTEESIRKIWELSKGNPSLVQLLCDGALDVAGLREEVTPDDVVQAWLTELRNNPHMIDYWD